MIRNVIKLIIITLIFSSCSLAPKYIKPKSPISQKKIDQLFSSKNHKDILWQDFFIDQDLIKIINLSLKNNRDLKIAALNIEQARAQYNVSLSNIFPKISASSSLERASQSSNNYKPTNNFTAKLALTNFEIDLFGKLQSIKNSNKQLYLSSKQNHKIIKISLIAQIVDSYIRFIANHQKMIYSYKIKNAIEQKYNIAKIRYENGIDSKSNLIEQKARLNNAKINLANDQNIVSQSRNLLQILIGNYDKKIFDNYTKIKEIDDIKIAHKSLNFIPSSKLLSRPDIKRAEHNLKAANANIGAARAMFFPSIMLTSNIGYASNQLTDLSTTRSIWNIGPKIDLPIFSAGSNYANLSLAKIRKKIEIINYQKAIEIAFKELKDQLSKKKSIDQELELAQEIFDLKHNEYDITKTKYDIGSESKYNLIDQQIVLYQAKQNYIDYKQEHLINSINLFKILGGGIELAKEIEL